MQLTTNERQITSTITGESRQFGVELSSVAFRTLIEGLYSDPYTTTLRELMSNALDAHIRNGNPDEPFEVRLPNEANPTFSVRDYGCSMTHEYVMTDYSTMFASDKRNDNAETGGWGLGSKSFLAIVDSSVLRCWLDGECRTYTVTLGANGIPEIKLVVASPSDEPRGVEINFTVASNAFSKFSKAYPFVAMGFDVAPTVVGQSVNTFTPSDVGPTWRCYSKHSSAVSQHSVRMGSAVYPYTPNFSMNQLIPADKFFVIDVPIGSVGMTASREMLAVSDDQAKFLAEQFSGALNELRDMYDEHYQELPTPKAKAMFAHVHSTLLNDRTRWPVTVNFDFELTEWLAGNSNDNPMVSKRSSFPITTLSKFVFIFDDGAPIKRRKRRLAKLQGTRRGGNFRQIFFVDSKANYDTIIADIEPDSRSAYVISEIPDVIEMKTDGTPKERSTRPKKIVQTDRVWAFCNRDTASVPIGGPIGDDYMEPSKLSKTTGCFSWSRSRGGALGLPSAVSAALRAGLNVGNITDSSILYLTKSEVERAIKKGTINPAMRIDRYLTAYVMTQGDEVAKSIIIANLPGTHSQNIVFMEKLGITHASVDSQVVDLFKRLQPDRYERMIKDASGISARLRKDYPMLFSSNDSDVVRRYITQCDAERNSLQFAVAND